METLKPKVSKYGLSYGLILGLLMILISVFAYVSGIALKGENWPNIIYYIAFPVGIFIAINTFKKDNAGLLSLGEAVKIGLLIAVISALLNVVYGIIFHYIIDPEFMGQMMEVVREKMLEQPNASEEMVNKQMEYVEMFSSPAVGLTMWVALSAFFGLIYSLIFGAILKKDGGY